MRTAASSALERLHTVARALGPDELAVLCLVAERLKIGRNRYGDLHIATDLRDFRAEALEEAADGLVYAAVALIRGRDSEHNDQGHQRQGPRTPDMGQV